MARGDNEGDFLIGNLGGILYMRVSGEYFGCVLVWFAWSFWWIGVIYEL